MQKDWTKALALLNIFSKRTSSNVNYKVLNEGTH